MKNSLGRGEARRLAIKAQGLNRASVAGKSRGHLKKCLERLGVLQIDSVNALVRAHYLPLFSRLGPYEREHLDELTWCRHSRRLCFEYWGHEASFLPLEMWPHLRWRMKRAADGRGIYKGLAEFGRQQRPFIRQVLKEVAERGPLGAGALSGGGGTGPWWGWSREKIALEWLFAAGEVTVASRRNFERLYDLPERVIPSEILSRPELPGEEARRHLFRQAAKALGVATEKDLRDYYRFEPADSKAALADLLSAGELLPVEVEGWKPAAYLWAGATVPKKVETGTLVSPFDSLVWERSRTERLFDFQYRLEFYTPAAKRVYGYYVLPFLYGERLVGRVDLKADRAGDRLLIPAVFSEAKNFEAEEIAALAANLVDLASWLGLSRIEFAKKGRLEKRLAAELLIRPPDKS